MVTRESVERQLEAAQQITHIGSWEWDIRTHQVTWSDELYRIYGLEPRSVEITFDRFLARVHPDDRENTIKHVRAALAKPGPFAYPERIVRPDGSIRELESKGTVVCNDAGEPVALIGTCRDVTEERERDKTIRLYADIVRNIQMGLAVWRVQDPNDIQKIVLVGFNPAAERLANLRLGDQLGKSLPDILPYATGGQLHQLLQKVARDRQVHEAVVLRSADPETPNRALSMKGFPLPDGCVGVGFEDITEATRVRRFREAEQRIFEMIASDVPLSEILTTLALAIEEHSPPVLASILLLDPDGIHVRHGSAPSLHEAYNRAVEGLCIGAQEGSCGTAMFLRRPVYVDDIETDPLWEKYRGIAREHGLRACWSTPILAADGRVLGSFALYYREARSPAPADEALIARAVRISSVAIQRTQLIDQLRALSSHVESVREDERTGIAREIHDQLGQALTALKIDLGWLARRAEENHNESSKEVGERIQSMFALTESVMAEIRRISSELRPAVLDDLGLVAALEWQALEYERRTGTKCTFASNAGEERLDPRLSTAVFRIFQESLTNVARHADATRVDVALQRHPRQLELTVLDDGKGITPAAVNNPRSLGLLGMRERARGLGGTVDVAGGPTGGTLLTLRVPCD
jgi:PAS domain S-box-containing protein